MSDRRQRFDAYYYSFEPTGCQEVDAILSAVAWAGKMYHCTEDWDEDNGPPGEPTEAARIQAAANESAAEVARLRAALKRAEDAEAGD
jgi:hypothetical protein